MTSEAPTNGLAAHLAAHEALNVSAKLEDHGKRINDLESTIDRMRGAFAVPAALLIITNLVLAAVGVAVVLGR